LRNEEEWRLKEFVEIISQADKRYLAELLNARFERKAWLDSQIETCDRKVIKNRISRATKKYNLTQAAHLLKVHRQTIYYWMKKGWVKSKRDYRSYPIFTVLDIENLVKWRNSVE
jgi:predicted RNA-binding protein YlxR (DUF448 family)